MTTMALAVDHGAQRSRDGWRSEPHVNSSQTFYGFSSGEKKIRASGAKTQIIGAR
jgi:hypothetical protein